jgi:hypothetical protein
LRMASGTSLAFPRPLPTWPFPSPTTTRALTLNRLPPDHLGDSVDINHPVRQFQCARINLRQCPSLLGNPD